MSDPLRFPRLPPLPQFKLPTLGVPKPIHEAVDAFVGAVKSTFEPKPPAPELPGSPAARALNAALSWHYPNGADGPAALKQLEGKSPSDLRQLRDAWRADFGGELDGAVSSKLSGAERDQALRLLRGTTPAASPLGDAVAAAAWASNHDHGTVPTADLYSTRNVFEGPYVNAKEIFPAMADAIAGAKHEVDLEFFDWNPSQYDKSPGWQNDPTMVLVDGIGRLQDRLKAEQAAGQAPQVPVKIYLAVDGPSRLHTSGELGMDEARDAARQLAALHLDPKLVEVHLGAHEWNQWGAMHTKALVVDGYKAMVTGANPQTSQALNNSWHDTGYGVRGEAGIALRKDFDDTWKRCAEVTSIDLSKVDGRPSVTTQPGGVIDHAPEVAHPDLDADPALRGAALPVFVATHQPYDVRQGVPDGDNPQDQAWLAMVSNAKQVVKIESPNLNDEKMKQAIADAVNRGTKVELVLSFGFNSSGERMSRAGQSAGGSNEDTIQDLYAQITDPAARQRLSLHWNSADGVSPTIGNGPGASHTKFMSADSAVAMVGSGNQDRVSWNIVRETNIVVDSAEAVGRCDGKVFDPDFSKGIDAIAWARAIAAGQVDTSGAIDGFLGGDAKAWAAKLLAAYDR